MIDTAAIGSVLSRATGTGWAAAYRQDVGALLDALEAAIAEAATMRAWAEEAAAAENANAEDARRERAAVVAWLRYESELRTGTNTATAFRVAEGLSGAAADIERGEHRREEKP